MKRREVILERVTQLVAMSVFWGITLGLTIDIAKREMGQPLIYKAEIAHAEETPKEVLIEAKIEWTKERIEQEVRATFPENPDLAVAIAKAESIGLNKDAYNPERHKGCSGSIGIMQIACVHHIENPGALFDVPFNLQKAREIYEGDGKTFNAWGAYKDGSYKRYMK